MKFIKQKSDCKFRWGEVESEHFHRCGLRVSPEFFIVQPNCAMAPLASSAIRLLAAGWLHTIRCSIIRTDRWCSGGEAGRGSTACSHTLTTGSTSPLSLSSCRPEVRDVQLLALAGQQTQLTVSSSTFPHHPSLPTSLSATSQASPLAVHDLIWVSHEIIHGAYWYYCSGCGSLHFREPQNSFHLPCAGEPTLQRQRDDPNPLKKAPNGGTDVYILGFLTRSFKSCCDEHILTYFLLVRIQHWATRF